MEFTKLTRKHGIKISPGFPCSVEDCSLAVGLVVGYGSLKSAARMNSAVVIFVDDVAKANRVVEAGVVIKGNFVSVTPLATPAKRVIISNIPPFISDDLLIRELSRHGKGVSRIKKLTSGCKSPLLNHLVSHRRQVYMILNRKDEELNLVFSVKVDDYDYVVFVTSGTVKCYGCGQEGHIIRACPAAAAVEAPADTQSHSTGENRQEETQGQGAGQGGAQGEAVEQQVAQGEAVGQQEERGKKEEVGQKKNEKNNKKSELGDQEEDEGHDEVGEQEEEAAGGGQTVLEGADRTAEDLVRDSDEDFMEEENVLMIPTQKRKEMENSSESQSSDRTTRKLRKRQGRRAESENSVEEEEEGDSQPLSVSASQQETLYTIKEIRKFLQTTKNMKNVKLEDHFEDKDLLLLSIRKQMRSKGDECFTEKEVYRLRKIVMKIKSELYDDDDSEAI